MVIAIPITLFWLVDPPVRAEVGGASPPPRRGGKRRLPVTVGQGGTGVPMCPIVRHGERAFTVSNRCHHRAVTVSVWRRPPWLAGRPPWHGWRLAAIARAVRTAWHGMAHRMAGPWRRACGMGRGLAWLARQARLIGRARRHGWPMAGAWHGWRVAWHGMARPL